MCLQRANLFPTTAGMRVLTGGFVDRTADFSQGWRQLGVYMEALHNQLLAEEAAPPGPCVHPSPTALGYK